MRKNQQLAHERGLWLRREPNRLNMPGNTMLTDLGHRGKCVLLRALPLSYSTTSIRTTSPLLTGILSRFLTRRYPSYHRVES